MSQPLTQTVASRYTPSKVSHILLPESCAGSSNVRRYQLVTKAGADSRKLAATSAVSTVTDPSSGASTATQDITVKNPKLWNLDMPNRYVAVTRLT
jgi:beta-galactosidase/beta-glucuronidase